VSGRTAQQGFVLRNPPTCDVGRKGQQSASTSAASAARPSSRERDLAIIEAEIQRLALLPDLAYQLEREAAAQRLRLSLSVLDKHVKSRRPRKAAKKSAPIFDPDKLQDGASHIIRHPDILSLFAKDFGEVIAGEAVNGKLLYLVGTSRLFAKPMNAAIKGTSASGKSEVRKRMLSFFPPEDVVRGSKRCTPRKVRSRDGGEAGAGSGWHPTVTRVNGRTCGRQVD
jgi:hypothetical protein